MRSLTSVSVAPIPVAVQWLLHGISFATLQAVFLSIFVLFLDADFNTDVALHPFLIVPRLGEIGPKGCK
jgi:hypothetical protein